MRRIVFHPPVEPARITGSLARGARKLLSEQCFFPESSVLLSSTWQSEIRSWPFRSPCCRGKNMTTIAKSALLAAALMLIVAAQGCARLDSPKDTRAEDGATIRAYGASLQRASRTKNLEKGISFYADGTLLVSATTAPLQRLLRKPRERTCKKTSRCRGQLVWEDLDCRRGTLWRPGLRAWPLHVYDSGSGREDQNTDGELPFGVGENHPAAIGRSLLIQTLKIRRPRHLRNSLGLKPAVRVCRHTPHVGRLHRRKTKSFLFGQKHHLCKQLDMRWSCIHRLSGRAMPYKCRSSVPLFRQGYRPIVLSFLVGHNRPAGKDTKDPESADEQRLPELETPMSSCTNRSKNYECPRKKGSASRTF